MKHGALDTDTSALVARISAHDAAGSEDFDGWILRSIAPKPGDDFLDLGCGTGKQVFLVADKIGPNGTVTGIDVSNEAVDIVTEKARDRGLDGRVTAIASGLDTLPQEVLERTYSRILASYSLYYTEAPNELLRMISRVLRPDGRFFFCGPTDGNNRELRKVIASLAGDTTLVPTKASQFMDELAPSLAIKWFETVEKFSFENPLTFHDAGGIYDYWHAHNLFDEEIAGEFKAYMDRHFATHSTFTTVKRVVGVLALKSS